MSQRIQRINQLLRKEVSEILLREIEFQNALVTITKVDASANLQQAKIYISVMPEGKAPEVLKLLQREIYAIQQKLNKRLFMRPIPRIIFMREEAVKEASRIEKLLEQVNDEKPIERT